MQKIGVGPKTAYEIDPWTIFKCSGCKPLLYFIFLQFFAVYLETGQVENAATMTISVASGPAPTPRSWKVKH